MRVIIREALLKIKGFFLSLPQELLVGLIVFLVGTASFGLGRLSGQEVVKQPVRILSPGDSLAKEALRADPGQGNQIAAVAAAGEVLASKNGSRYHFPWCPGAKSISEKNRVSFKSPAAAEAAGYTLAANCK